MFEDEIYILKSAQKYFILKNCVQNYFLPSQVRLADLSKYS